MKIVSTVESDDNIIAGGGGYGDDNIIGGREILSDENIINGGLIYKCFYSYFTFTGLFMSEFITRCSNKLRGVLSSGCFRLC